MHGDLSGPSLECPSQTLLIRPPILTGLCSSLHTKVEIYPHTSGLGIALLHIQYSSIIAWIHCQDAESVTLTLLPLKALIWEWEAQAAAVKTSAKRLKCKCMKMCSKTVGWVIWDSSTGSCQGRLMASRACGLDFCFRGGKNFRSAKRFVELIFIWPRLRVSI